MLVIQIALGIIVAWVLIQIAPIVLGLAITAPLALFATLNKPRSIRFRSTEWITLGIVAAGFLAVVIYSAARPYIN